MATRSTEAQTIGLVATSVAAGAALCYAALSMSKRTTSPHKYEIPDAIQASPFKEHVRLAVDLAITAGENMRAYCEEKGTEAELGHDLNVSTKKNPEDFCTKIDVENEKMVMDGILQSFPNHKIIGEETTGTGKIPPLTNDPTWIIDPIDGTTNFASGLPMCCVSIGFCMDGKPVMGVVYAPITGELYIAASGYGAFRNAAKIVQTKKNTPLKEAVICFEFGYARDKKEVSAMVGVVESIMNHGCRASRQVGSGVLDLCYVATGRLDAVYAGVASEGWKPWDYCAGYVIATEAGCVMESLNQLDSQESFDLYSKSHICAQNKGLLEEVRAFAKPRML
uniref:Inositol-1-monophosphatase n=1 Tax=Entomoneis paludosa TaxID=265537 RepID=A0A7S2YF70_9STRA|mmetsp:Transcript_30552/g.63799  ORF Transcript_30552/g.63799 Transcript_30552/m.63799 type:complete len:337 (+) Transcript_30552:70-1080(+)